MNLQVGVKVLLRNSEGKYLILERNMEKYPDMSKRAAWDLVGGRIEPGAPLLENLRREVLEEAGLNLEKIDRLIAAQDILRSDKHVVRLTYVADISGEPKLSDEHVAYKWATIAEMKTMENLDDIAKEILDLV